MDSKGYSVLSTLLYADIFDFPLSEDELWYFSGQIIDRSTLTQFIRNTPSIQQDEQYVFLSGRAHISSLRQKRELWSARKLEEGKDIARFLSFFPTVLFIGASGSVAASNAKKSDDIDLFVITRSKTLFVTRFFLLFFLELLRRRRRRGERKVNNKICLNFLIDSSEISFKARKDLYTAHEIVQLVPLFERENMHIRFLRSNSWVYSFFPNARELIQKKRVHLRKRRTGWAIIPLIMSFTLLEPVFRGVQTLKMKAHLKSETVTKTKLAFHPKEYRDIVLHKYKKRRKAHLN